MATILRHVGPGTPDVLEVRQLGGAPGREPAVPNAVGHRHGAVTVYTTEYASVFVRTVNRIVGTAAGAPTADPVLPALRLLDTLLGAAVAVLVGYLFWPGARRLPTTAQLGAAIDAARAYLAAALEPEQHRSGWRATRDDAYRLAHRARRTAEAALLEPHR